MNRLRYSLIAVAACLPLAAELPSPPGLYLYKEYRTRHNGVTHRVYRQQFQGTDVYNSEYTVNIDRQGQVLNAGGMLASAPGEGVAAPAAVSALRALHAALLAVNPRAASGYFEVAAGKGVRFTRAGAGEELEGQPIWYRNGDVPRPAWVFYVPGENGIDRFATVVDDASQKILAQDNLTWYQSPPRGLVFEKGSPQPNPRPGIRLTEAPPYVERTLQPFAGDPVASPRGWVSGNGTAGNNVIAAHNPMGVMFLANAPIAVSPAADFSFPLELGPGAPNPLNFRDAAITNLFYWANRAHDLFYEIGFDEAAGNFQQDNFHRGGAGGDPMLAFSQFGSAGNTIAALNNAFFISWRSDEDGVPASIGMFIGGSRPNNVFSDGSFDAEAIIHEYAHGVSKRLVRQLTGHQGGAMGEAWSDFFGLEFTMPEGAPADGSYPQNEYLFQSFGTGVRTRPYSTNMDVNPLSLQSLGRVGSAPEVHDDGEIWANTLWEMRANLIGQFGEKEGRRRARLLVIDGMKLSPPAPTMVDMRDAILLADRVDFNGASQDQIWTAFAKRGLGVLAQSSGPDSVHVTASFEKPSAEASMRFAEDVYVLGEQVRIALQDGNSNAASVQVRLTSSSGDLESVVLQRKGSFFSGAISTSTSGSVTRGNRALEVIPGDSISAYYLDPDTGAGAKEIQITSPTSLSYTMLGYTTAPAFLFGTERPLFPRFTSRSAGGLRTAVVLPFEFPFFNGKHSRVYVHSDGLLTFDLPKFGACNDASTLAKNIAIAPLLMDLAYGGTAQPDQNVYMSEGPKSVTFRWAAETQPFLVSNLVRPSPVNFSATLFDDGRIQFQYGEGNHGLTNSALLGCSASAPTIGISNGHETYTQLHTLVHGQPDLDKGPTAVFEPPFNFSSFPELKLESPAADEHVQGLLKVRGVAWDRDGIARLDVLVDGVARGRAGTGISRPDFCATQRVPGCPSVGFSMNLDPARLGIAPGEHNLRIRATSRRGAFVDSPEEPLSFIVEEGVAQPATGVIESPQDGAEVSGTLQVKGYAYSSLRVLAVDLIIDGVTYGPTTYNQRRDDICAPMAEKPANCPNVGFTMNFDTRGGSVPLPNGEHTLQVRIRDEAGQYTLVPETPLGIVINNAVNEPPRGVLLLPEPNQKLSGVVKIYGYAWDPDGRITSAALIIDGATYSFAPVRINVPRPGECEQLPDVAACPDIGFEADLDTHQLSNGLHTLGVRVSDGRTSVVLPNLVRNGVNVFVEN